MVWAGSCEIFLGIIAKKSLKSHWKPKIALRINKTKKRVKSPPNENSQQWNIDNLNERGGRAFWSRNILKILSTFEYAWQIVSFIVINLG